MDLFKLLGTIAIENSDANKAIDDTTKKGEESESKLKKAFSAVGKGALAVGKVVGTGMAAGAAAMGALTIKALNLSGELEQNMGGSEAVFGKYATKMQETAKNAFSNMGLSTSDFLGTANKMGALFQGAGFSIEESSNLAADSMQRAADVASIMGISTEDAMEAIAGAAKGNFTMMDNLGVAMNDTTLQAYALEKGINKSTTEMTNQEKIGLAMEMFMEKTAYAAGNYAKENETLAGSLGTAKSALTNFLDGSGSVDQLVSAFSNAANVIVRNVTEIAPRLISGLTQAVTQLMPLIPPLLQQLLPVILEGATSLINGIVVILPQLMQMLTTSVIPQLLTSFVSIVNAITTALPQLIQSIVAYLPILIPQLISGLVSMVVTLFSNFAQIIQPIITYLPAIITSIVSAILQNLPILIQGLIALCLGIANALPQIVTALVDKIPQIVAMIVTELLRSLPALIKGAIQLVIGIVSSLDKILASLKQALPNAFIGIWNGIKNIFADVSPWFSKKFNEAKEKVASAFSDIKEKLSKPFESAKEKISEIADKIKGFFKGEISMPKIKTPKFSIKPKGWEIGDLLDGVIPKLGITWHAKGAIMKEPTLFGYNPATGNVHGGGEAGDEAIAPINTLQQYVGAAVRAENSGLAAKLDKIISMLVQFFPEMLEAMNINMVLDTGVLVAETAGMYDTALGKIAIKKGRGR